MLDIASVNAFVLYNLYKNNIEINRAEFIKTLAFSLVKPEMKRQFESKRITPFKNCFDFEQKRLTETDIFDKWLEVK